MFLLQMPGCFQLLSAVDYKSVLLFQNSQLVGERPLLSELVDSIRHFKYKALSCTGIYKLPVECQCCGMHWGSLSLFRQ